MRFHEFPSAIALFIETPPNMARGPILSQASLGSGLFFEESGHPRLRKNPATLLVNRRYYYDDDKHHNCICMWTVNYI